MTVDANPGKRDDRRDLWLQLVEQTADEVVAWADAEGWSVHRAPKTINEDHLGTYAVSTVRVRLPEGEVHLNPVARNIIGADGRIDLESWPTLARVKLIRRDNRWWIFTDNNVEMEQVWGRELFARLSRDLVGQG